MRILCFGEILWDIIKGVPHIGGAPFNVAAHISRLGGEAYIVSQVGDDDLGRKALRRARELGVRTDFCPVHPELPTGTVPVTFDGHGNHSFNITENSAWDDLNLPEEMIKEITALPWTACCFGSLAQRTEVNRKLLNRLLGEVACEEKFFDVNLRQHYYSKQVVEHSFKQATIVKLNEEEMGIIDRMLFSGSSLPGKKMSSQSGNGHTPEIRFTEKVRRTYNVHTVCVTKGGDGVIIDHQGDVTELSAPEVTVKDTIGAGDSFSATYLRFWHDTQAVLPSAEGAVKVSAFVASCEGAVPEYPPGLI